MSEGMHDHHLDETIGRRATHRQARSERQFPTRVLRMSLDKSQVKEVFINEGRGNSPSHLKFFLLVFSKLKEDIK